MKKTLLFLAGVLVLSKMFGRGSGKDNTQTQQNTTGNKWGDAAGQAGAGLTGKFSWPVKGRITSPFGYRIHPIKKERKLHNGVDISVPVGTKITNPLPGKVVAASYDDTNGNYIVIKHDNGFQTGYAHLSEKYVGKGDRVSEGKVIGLTGNTGSSTGPHLHLTVRKNGELVNPEKYFA